MEEDSGRSGSYPCPSVVALNGYPNNNNFSGVVLRFDSQLPRSIPPTFSSGSNV
jgi:hypothetical protein